MLLPARIVEFNLCIQQSESDPPPLTVLDISLEEEFNMSFALPELTQIPPPRGDRESIEF